MTDADNSLPQIARPEELDYTLTCAAYSNTSHTPERRAQSDQKAFAEDVNGFYADMVKRCTNEAQRAILDAEILRYKENYLKLYRAYLHSHSRVASSFITGPSNFPVRQMEKRNRWANNKLTAFNDWRSRARQAISEKIEAARTPQEQAEEEWQRLKRDLLISLGTIESIDERRLPYTRSAFANSIVGKVERLANNGAADLVEKAVALVTEYNAQHKKPAISRANKLWTFPELARGKSIPPASLPEETQTLHEDEGFQVVVNPALDRVQILFEQIPPADLREKLKSAGWHWSRQEGAWQRKLTEAAKYSARQILGIAEFHHVPPAAATPFPPEPTPPASAPKPAPPERAPEPAAPSTQAKSLQKARTLTLDLEFG